MTPLLSPLAALGSAATLGIADFNGGLAGRRTPAPSVTVGIELCGLVMLPLAIWLLPLGWDVRAAFLAGVSFGLFFVLFHAASVAGVTAFISGRLGSGLAGLGAALISGVPFIARRSAWRLIAIGGALDGSGVVLYLYASRSGLLSLTALLASFYPAFTVLCARLFTRERLTALQAVGAAMAVAAVAMIAGS